MLIVVFLIVAIVLSLLAGLGPWRGPEGAPRVHFGWLSITFIALAMLAGQLGWS